ncbi:hypothetical protein [Altererythrobacter sp.]|uniref:hypothetical protein n=1 Tax=Altererythrobacter sp. TaxID=1872480 RepID=UPI001B0B1A42|nr:hypothetical protein [Altererythrobacter sp.]MBO6608884.1 hypothetical protein [Altererythrobacter sp.]MBO6640924.1 hypothetical protein [Altererythrobacter sp.]MBO6708378.1 hypothetical protein [Altererythrobacter sp.]MBO6945485.1 hypothetical protein [Altererythrobacter sp.]
MRRSLFALALMALGACGQRADIEPPANASLPTAPFGSEAKPEAEQLLELETLAAPERSVELRRRSEEREDDPFDLPPE